jgi:hypothetical protein
LPLLSLRSSLKQQTSNSINGLQETQNRKATIESQEKKEEEEEA